LQTTYIEAGKLRQRITVTDPATVGGTQAPDGELIPDADPAPIYKDLPARIEFVSGKQVYTAATFTSQVTHRVTIRWAPGIKPQQRITFLDAEGQTRQLQIMFIDNPDERRRMLILNCLERDQSARADVVTQI